MEMRQTPSEFPPLDISLQSLVNVISRYELELLGVRVWENIEVQEPIILVEATEIGIREDLRTSLALALAPPGVTSVAARRDHPSEDPTVCFQRPPSYHLGSCLYL